MSPTTSTAGLAFVALLVLACLLPSRAEAYIDPGTGSYLVQAIVAGLMGALMVTRTYWHRIKGFFRGESADAPSATSGETNESADPGGK